MKKIVVAIMVLTMMVSAIAAMAQAEKNFSITPRIAADFYLNGDTKDTLGKSFGLLFDIDVASLPVGFEVGYLQGSKTTDGYFTDDEGYEYGYDEKATVKQIPLLITYKYPFAENFYAKVGAGVSFNRGKYEVSANDEIYGPVLDVDSSCKKTNFAWTIGFGYNFAQNFSAELAYRDSGKFKADDDADGVKSGAIEINVGYTF